MTEKDLENIKLIADTFVENFNNGNIDIHDLENKGTLDIKFPGGYDTTIHFYKDPEYEEFHYIILDENFEQVYPELPSKILKRMGLIEEHPRYYHHGHKFGEYTMVTPKQSKDIANKNEEIYQELQKNGRTYC